DGSLAGRLDIALKPTLQINGQLDVDDVDIFMLLGLAIGFPQQVPGLGSVEPFGPGAFGKFDGRVEFNAARAIVTPTLVARNAHGVLRIAGNQVALESFGGSLAGGRLARGFPFPP